MSGRSKKSKGQKKKRQQKRIQRHVDEESDSEEQPVASHLWDAVADGTGMLFDLFNWTIVLPIQKTTGFVANVALAAQQVAVGGVVGCYNFCKDTLYSITTFPVNIFQRMRADPTTSAKMKKKLKKLEWELSKLRKENKDYQTELRKLRKTMPDMDQIMTRVQEHIKKSHRDLRPLQGAPLAVPVLPAGPVPLPPPPPPPPPMPTMKPKAETAGDDAPHRSVTRKPNPQQQSFVMSIDLLKNVKLRRTQTQIEIPAAESAETVSSFVDATLSSGSSTSSSSSSPALSTESNKENDLPLPRLSEPAPATLPVPRQALKRVTVARSPGGTPLRPNNSQTKSPTHAKFFNRALSDKFRHARTPPKEPMQQAESAL